MTRFFNQAYPRAGTSQPIASASQVFMPATPGGDGPVGTTGGDAPVAALSPYPLATARMCERLERLGDFADSLRLQADEMHRTGNRLRADYDTARAALAHATHPREEQADPASVERLKRDAERAKRHWQEHQERAGEFVGIIENANAIHNACHRAAVQLKDEARDFDVNVPANTTVADAAATVVKIVADRQSVLEAPEPLDAATARILAKIDRAADAGAPKIITKHRERRDRRGRADYTAPQFALRFPCTLDMAPSGADVEMFDAHAAFCWAHRDTIKKAATEQLKKRYANIKLTFTETERKKRLAELDAELLQAERVYAALVWAEVERGGDVEFVPLADSRAILGIA